MSLGQNTPSGKQLQSFIERLERVNDDIKALGHDRAALYAELKAQGFAPKTVREVVKRRAAKPHDLQEADELLDIYLHALGMAPEPPLFRGMALAGHDRHAREAILAHMKELVPPGGEIIVKIGQAMRLWRDKEGAHAEPWEPPTSAPEPPAAPAPLAKPKREAPDVDDEGARALGREAGIDNKPVIDNPFPFGDPRRARWDEGWREAAGSDGMGPAEEKPQAGEKPRRKKKK